MARLIHLNGPPGIGKTTLAKRYVGDHHGVLNCDVDVLRTFIGGWEDDFVEAGALIRPAALALIEAYLRGGHDVVFPQLLVDPTELARFEACADRAGAVFVERVLMDTAAASVARFEHRGTAQPHDPWHEQVQAIVQAAGGRRLLTEYHEALERLIIVRPQAVVIKSAEGKVEETYDALLASLTFHRARSHQ